MRRVLLAAAVLCLPVEASAQDWVPWMRDSPYNMHQRRPVAVPQRAEATAKLSQQRRQPGGASFAFGQSAPPAPALLDGGPRPSISPIPPQEVSFSGRFSPGSIVIDTAGRRLYLVTSRGSALRYPIGVGRIGFTWTGTERISRVANWPDWHPPKEMRERDPRLPEKMTGGVRNPLGAMALYLGNSLYRIHGTNDQRSIGGAGSSGCFRMMNGHVVDLAGRVGVGTTVHVLSRLPANSYADADTDEPTRAAPRRRTIVR